MEVGNSTRSDDPRDPWHLPEVLGITAARRRYAEPKQRYRDRQVVSFNEAVELTLRTSSEFPVRAWSPAIFVGDVALSDYEMIGPQTYRFYAFDIASLQEGAPVFIGWPQLPGTKRRTGFTYRLGGPPPVA